jgi:NADH:ubiquinone oxidoreductase subunit 5 (subunit L)/multisubunit Na+/H+ antiporter MnhA subunit
MLESYVWLLPLGYWLAAGWIGLGQVLGWGQGEAGERSTARVALGAGVLGLLLTLGLGVQAWIEGSPGQLVLAPWLLSGDYRVSISFRLDPLGLSLGTVTAAIGLLTLRFSVNYLHRERGFQGFFLLLCLFLGAMELIFLGGNLVMVFVGWELAGVSSFLLIAYVYERPAAADNAARVLVTNRIGDAGFLLGIFLAFRWLGGVEWSTLDQSPTLLTPLQADLLALALLLAALVKSAQVPFAPWISRALEGPTPSSAIFYGSLMVHAGVYLLIRLAPVLAQAPALLTLLILVGLATALYGWLTGLVQADVKSALMASTSAQVGLMLVWCGLGWNQLAAWHLGLHAAWRAYQFLQAPAFMQLKIGRASCRERVS